MLFLNKPEFIGLNSLKYCYLKLVILFNINDLFAHSLMILSITI